MKLPIEDSPLFAADIEVSYYEEEGVFILTIDELARMIEGRLRQQNINCVSKNVLTGNRAKPLFELSLPEDVEFDVVIEEIRQALDGNNIDYYEPYVLGAHSTEFRFITPNVSVLT